MLGSVISSCDLEMVCASLCSLPPVQMQVDSSADEGCIPKVFQLLGFGLAQAIGEISFYTTHLKSFQCCKLVHLCQGDRQCLLAACSAIERVCQDSFELFSLHVTLLF